MSARGGIRRRVGVVGGHRGGGLRALGDWHDLDEDCPLAVEPHECPEDTYVGLWVFLRDLATALTRSMEDYRKGSRPTPALSSSSR